MTKNSSTCLRLGSVVPDFTTGSTLGRFNFYEYIEDSWALFFSHPSDFTPVCTTELGAFAKEQSEWASRGVKLVGLSIDSAKDHLEWIKDIQLVHGLSGAFPFVIVADEEGQVASQFGMLDSPLHDPTNIRTATSGKKEMPMTVRSVYFIDPLKRVRAMWTYPASTGRNVFEILRVIDSIQLADRYKIATPVNWVPGNKVIVRVDIKDEEAKTLFPQCEAVLPYLRYTSDPSKQ